MLITNNLLQVNTISTVTGTTLLPERAYRKWQADWFTRARDSRCAEASKNSAAVVRVAHCSRPYNKNVTIFLLWLLLPFYPLSSWASGTSEGIRPCVGLILIKFSEKFTSLAEHNNIRVNVRVSKGKTKELIFQSISEKVHRKFTLHRE
jgi:hypothetical protein